MRPQFAIPASALLLAFSAAAWFRAPQPPSPERMMARAGAGAIRAIAFAGERATAPEASHAAAPLTLASTRPDALAPSGAEEGLAAIERYRDLAFEAARAKTAVVVADPEAGRLAKSAAIAEFERKCSASAATPEGSTKPKCTTGAIDVPDVPIVGCYLQQAASALLG
jgi:hypothetical protein